MELNLFRPTVKALLTSREAYLISDTQEGGLIERGLIGEGRIFTHSTDMDTNDGLSVLLLHILWIQHTILRVKSKFGKYFILNNIKINMQAYLAK